MDSSKEPALTMARKSFRAEDKKDEKGYQFK